MLNVEWSRYLPRSEEDHLRTAIIFHEGGRDFIYISTLGAGCQGQALLVRQISGEPLNANNNGSINSNNNEDTGKTSLFVRKRAMRRGNTIQRPSTPTEVKYPQPYPNTGVPNVHYWQPYSVSDRKHDFSCLQTFCNGGSLEDLWGKFADQEKFVPELFLWEVLESLSEILDWIHNVADPPVAHHDLNPANIFLHYPNNNDDQDDDEATNPEIFLGDFGYAVPLVREGDSNDGNDSVVPPEAYPKFITLDIYRMTTVVIRLAIAGFGLDMGPQLRSDDFGGDSDWSYGTPYSQRLVSVLYNVRRMSKEHSNLNTRTVWETYVKQECLYGQREALAGGKEWCVNWTRPTVSTSPLLMENKDLARLSDPDHELRYRILGDNERSYTTDDDKGKLGILPPFSYVLVNPETLEIVRERAWEEIAALGVVYGFRTVENVMGREETMNMRGEGNDSSDSEEGGATLVASFDILGDDYDDDNERAGSPYLLSDDEEEEERKRKAGKNPFAPLATASSTTTTTDSENSGGGDPMDDIIATIETEEAAEDLEPLLAHHGNIESESERDLDIDSGESE